MQKIAKKKDDNDNKHISYDKKIELITVLITWCERVINDLLNFSKKINSYHKKENIYITYDIVDYCLPVRQYFEKKEYLRYLRQEEEDLMFIKDLPQIIQK